MGTVILMQEGMLPWVKPVVHYFTCRGRNFTPQNTAKHTCSCGTAIQDPGRGLQSQVCPVHGWDFSPWAKLLLVAVCLRTQAADTKLHRAEGQLWLHMLLAPEMLSPSLAEYPNPTARATCGGCFTFLLGVDKGTPDVSDPSDTRKILINKIVPIKSV